MLRVRISPSISRVAYTLSVIFLVLALLVLPFDIGNSSSLYMDLLVIAMLSVFIIYIIMDARRS
ncbi:hypothetical protein [Thermocladium modestius]|uniref:hypothetical protein n=1 Tax=Thermocladium modestius TaxID=62609 RepID=UPI0009466F96|nr:hypothetical protein [Thermocladium modestius]